MPVDRVNLVREGFEAWNADDPQWVLNHMSPEVEWVAPERDPFPGTYKGYEGVQESGPVAQRPEKFYGGDHVVVIAHRWARNDITGLQISDKIAQVFSSTTRTSASGSRSSTTGARRSRPPALAAKIRLPK